MAAGNVQESMQHSLAAEKGKEPKGERIQLSSSTESPPGVEKLPTSEAFVDIESATQITKKKRRRRSTTKGNSDREPNEPTPWTTFLTVVVLIASGSFAAPITFQALYPVLPTDYGKIIRLSIRDLFTYPNSIVDGFFFYTTITIAYISAMIGMVVTVSMIFRKRQWGTALTLFTSFVITAMLLNFCSTLGKINPRIIKIDGVNQELPGGYVLAFYSAYVTCIAAIVAIIIQKVLTWW